MRALIFAAPGVEDSEFIYPFYRLQEVTPRAAFTRWTTQCVEIAPRTCCYSLSFFFLHLTQELVRRRFVLLE